MFLELSKERLTFIGERVEQVEHWVPSFQFSLESVKVQLRTRKLRRTPVAKAYVLIAFDLGSGLLVEDCAQPSMSSILQPTA